MNEQTTQTPVGKYDGTPYKSFEEILASATERTKAGEPPHAVIQDLVDGYNFGWGSANCEAITKAAKAGEPQPEPEPTPAPKPVERTWKSSAGPVQSNKVRKAITAINTEGRTFVERYGVIGGESSDHVLFSPFSPPRAEAGVAWKELGDRFGWQVTRENYADIITAAGELVERLKSSRQVNDCRRTAEQQAEMDREAKEREERDMAEREKREQERQTAEQARGTAFTGGKPVVVRYNKEHNGIEVLFPDKPGADVRNVLKGMGMRWSRFSGVWYTRYTPEMWGTAHRSMGLDVPPPPVGLYHCSICGRNNAFVNQCGCDKNNMPTHSDTHDMREPKRLA